MQEAMHAEPRVMPPLEPEARPIALPQADGWLAVCERLADKGVTPETMHQILDLKIRMEDRLAAAEYGNAIAGFQADAPTVLKDRAVKDKGGDPMYYFADYADIRTATRELHARYKIAVSFVGIKHEENPKTQFGQLTGACRLRVGSHFEDHTFVMAVPKGMNTNQSQEYMQAVTYFKRGAYCAALDIITSDRDYDGRNLAELIGDAALAEVKQLIKEKGVSEEKFLAWATEAAGVQVDSLDKMPLAIMEEAMGLLRRKPVVKGGKK